MSTQFFHRVLPIAALCAAAAFGQSPLRIFWLGNSLSTNGDHSRLDEVGRACKQFGKTCEFTYGAYHYDESWGWYNAPENKAKVETGDWDYVVLQVFGASGTHLVSSHYNDFPMDSMKAVVKKWDALIKQSGAKTILYLPWGLEGAKPQWNAGTKAWNPDRMDTITANLKQIAQDIGSLVFPAGTAQWEVLKKHPTIAMHSDWIHGTLPAGYLAGLVSFSALTGEDPRKVNNFYNLDAGIADIMRQIAFETLTRPDIVPLVTPMQGVPVLRPGRARSGLNLKAAPHGRGIRLSYSFPGQSRIGLDVMDMAGHRVRRLILAGDGNGSGTAEWDGLGDDGAPAGPGLYLLSSTAGGARTGITVLKPQ